MRTRPYYLALTLERTDGIANVSVTIPDLAELMDHLMTPAVLPLGCRRPEFALAVWTAAPTDYASECIKGIDAAYPELGFGAGLRFVMPGDECDSAISFGQPVIVKDLRKAAVRLPFSYTSRITANSLDHPVNFATRLYVEIARAFRRSAASRSLKS
eukprot:SAG31_NODE_363_length_16899_cov_9.812976_14_plen_157_part_00